MMRFYKNGVRGLKNLYEGAARAIGDPSSLGKLIPSSWIERHEKFKKQQRINSWLTDRLNGAVTYVKSLQEESQKAIGAKDQRIGELESALAAKTKEYNEVTEEAEETQRQLSYARHWKRDVVIARRDMLQAHAQLEATKSRRTVVFAADSKDRITYISPAAERMLGYKEEEVDRQDIYSLLKGSSQRTTGQIKYTVQTEIMNNKPEKVSIPDAMIVRADNKKPINANLTILPIFAGETYVGSIIRGESKEERAERLEAEKRAKQKEEEKATTAFEEQVSRAKKIVAEQIQLLTNKPSRKNN